MSRAVVVREIVQEDLNRGFLESLDNLIPGTSELKNERTQQLMNEIQSNPLHRIFVASKPKGNEEQVVGTTTLLVEPKFIFKGGRVGHIEDVSVRKGFERMGIGAKLVRHADKVAKAMGCTKLVLDCSDQNIRFYEKLGYTYQDNCMKKFLKNHAQS
jgi:glucosamine-phosphate N-acetyltransferase